MLMGGVGLALLAGCSLPTSLVPGEPNVSKYSEKKQRARGVCVARVAEGGIPHHSDLDFQRLQDYRASIVTADEVLDIVKYKDGSRVSLYQGPPWADQARCARACATVCRIQSDSSMTWMS
jgi:hypothetical protein